MDTETLTEGNKKEKENEVAYLLLACQTSLLREDLRETRGNKMELTIFFNFKI